ncbi:MAG TPA: acetyltransferase [Thermoleophilaceae bacterium]|nr:acetyltransferase [Thermoleophilaceae bacterium]
MSSGDRKLLLAGAGGFARETAEAVRAVNAVRPTWLLAGFLDDDPSMHGTSIGGVPVVGPIEAAHDHPDAEIVICTASPDAHLSRGLIADRLGLDDERYATVVHPTATIGESSRVGAGSVLLAHADLTADVVVGRHVAVMPQVVLTHDVRIDDCATIASGVTISGGCHVAEGAYVGTGVCLRERITVGERAMVGMGSVVTRDVPSERLWFGAPARDVSRAPQPAVTSQRSA